MKPIESKKFKEWFANSMIVDDLGVPLVVYHGTQSDFSVFDPDNRNRVSGADPTAFIGSHFAKEIEVANKFAHGLYNENKYTESMGALVMPVYLKINNVFYVHEDTMYSAMFDGIYNSAVVDEALYEEAYRSGLSDDEAESRYIEDSDDGRKFRSAVNGRASNMELQTDDDSLAREMGEAYRDKLKAMGFDGIEYENRREGGTSYIIFDSFQVKSAIGNPGSFDITRRCIVDSDPETEAANRLNQVNLTQENNFELEMEYGF